MNWVLILGLLYLIPIAVFVGKALWKGQPMLIFGMHPTQFIPSFSDVINRRVKSHQYALTVLIGIYVFVAYPLGFWPQQVANIIWVLTGKRVFAPLSRKINRMASKKVMGR